MNLSPSLKNSIAVCYNRYYYYYYYCSNNSTVPRNLNTCLDDPLSLFLFSNRAKKKREREKFNSIHLEKMKRKKNGEEK